jgi:hypothetical protein
LIPPLSLLSKAQLLSPSAINSELWAKAAKENNRENRGLLCQQVHVVGDDALQELGGIIAGDRDNATVVKQGNVRARHRPADPGCIRRSFWYISRNT